MKEYKITLEELGNYVDGGVIIYNNKKYEFENYYYDSFDYVMINYGNDDELEDGTAQNEIIEVGRISDDAIRIKEIGVNVYEVEPLAEDEEVDNE